MGDVHCGSCDGFLFDSKDGWTGGVCPRCGMLRERIASDAEAAVAAEPEAPTMPDAELPADAVKPDPAGVPSDQPIAEQMPPAAKTPLDAAKEAV